ncbi:hypothetical protein FCL53_10735 [Elizabethkingia meningoseptica]|uniref:hypothetical protein n=1 Tax=Elizabethkingia meningoseptica TaxID=238 RepID=UPI001365F495|nr:hypothetical protein [Elizabethkingia meningoseptica]MVW92440.1 hypothetical protein [Elizabethkingia meningoseptica]
MKTKYVKVPVSERLPEERVDVIIIDEYGDKGEGFVLPDNDWMVYSDSVTGSIEYWLEPVPDHSEEMLSLLEEVKNKFKPSLSHPLEEGQEEFINQIEQLINKVKYNG